MAGGQKRNSCYSKLDMQVPRQMQSGAELELQREMPARTVPLVSTVHVLAQRNRKHTEKQLKMILFMKWVEICSYTVLI